MLKTLEGIFPLLKRPVVTIRLVKTDAEYLSNVTYHSCVRFAFFFGYEFSFIHRIK